MTSDGEAAAAERRGREARRRRLAEIFGDVLPDSTRDERAEGSEPGHEGSERGQEGSERGQEGSERGQEEAWSRTARDDEIRRDVPPHHDDPRLSD